MTTATPSRTSRRHTDWPTRMRGLLLALCLASEPAAARDVYVSNAHGNDHHEGSAAVGQGRGPVRSIARALRLAAPGDRIIVENTGQPYRETLSLVGSRLSGGELGPLIIEGQGATLDGSVDIPANAWRHEHGDVFSYQPARLGFQQLFVGPGLGVRRPADRGAATSPLLHPQEWCYWRGRIYFRVDRGYLPQDYPLACCGKQSGITLYYVRDVLIRNLTLQGFQLDGVAVHDVARDVRLQGIVCRANGQAGISVRGAARVELDDCTLVDNGAAQLRVADFARVWLDDCHLSDETAPAIEQLGGQVTIANGAALPPRP